MPAAGMQLPQGAAPHFTSLRMLNNCLRIEAAAQAVQFPRAAVSPLGLIAPRSCPELALQLKSSDLPSPVAAALGDPKLCSAKAHLAGKG